MRRSRTHIFLILCAAALSLCVLASCRGKTYHSEYRNLPQRQWSSRDTLRFDIPQVEADAEVLISVALRNTSHFRYKEIVMRLEILEGRKVVASTRLTVTPERRFLFNESHSKPQLFRLKAHKTYAFRLTQIMRLSPLDEITDVGILVADNQSVSSFTFADGWQRIRDFDWHSIQWPFQ